MTQLRETFDTRSIPTFFEQVFTGEDGRPMQFYSVQHKIGVFMTRDQVVAGHSLIVPDQRDVPSALRYQRVDQLSPDARDKLSYVSAHIGAQMAVALVPEPRPSQELIIGDDVAYPHIHRIPSNVRGDVITGLASKTFINLSAGQLEDLDGMLHFPDELAALVDAELKLPPSERVHPLEVANDFVTRPS